MQHFRLLRADEIDARVAMVKKTGCSVLLYKDARVDQNILDETFGMFGWQRHHEIIGGNLYCTVAVKDPETGEWVEKQDVGTESNTEKEKGQASDSFKRACFNFGIGRELYSAPKIWIPADINEYDLCVKHIAYSEDRQITELQISNKKTNAVIFSFGCGKSEAKQEARANTQPKAEKAAEAPKTHEP